MTALLKLIRTHWLAILLVAIGCWLRFTQLSDAGILLGKMGHQPALCYWVLAGLGSLLLIAVYEFCLVRVNQRIGLLALALLSFSPLALAYSPSVEVYLLLYCLLLPALITLSWKYSSKPTRWNRLILVVIISGAAVINLLACQFLVQRFSTQSQILTWATHQTQSSTLIITSSDPKLITARNFDSYLKISQGLGLTLLTPEEAALQPNHWPTLIINPISATTPPFVFTGFHSSLAPSKTFYTANITARLMP